MSVKIGLVGTGTVGGGCIDIILKHKDDFKKHYGIDIELARVCSLNSAEAEAHGVGDLFTPDFNEIINDPDIDIVIELIGGTGVAHTIVCNALRAGKNVVTANKALMSTAGEEIFELADEAGVEIAFEASVGGGIPIIDPLKHCLISNEIVSVMGIVNGTTNYMLTRMDEDGMSYDDALAEAQGKGFAEANPTADVDGFDAAAKIAILASIAFNSRVTQEQVHTEGIRGIDAQDVRAAETWGGVIKLIGRAVRREDGKLYIIVAPMLIPGNVLISAVKDVFNAVLVRGNAVGDVMFYGRGAGKMPTASAVVADVIDEVKHIKARKYLCWDKADPDMILPYEEQTVRSYLRIKGDAVAALKQLERHFGPVERIPAGDDQTLTVILPPLPEKECDRRLAEITAGTVASRLRVVTFG